MLLQEINSLYVQHVLETAVDDLSGAWLDPAMVVYEYVPRFEQKLAAPKASGPNG